MAQEGLPGDEELRSDHSRRGAARMKVPQTGEKGNCGGGRELCVFVKQKESQCQWRLE